MTKDKGTIVRDQLGSQVSLAGQDDWKAAQDKVDERSLVEKEGWSAPLLVTCPGLLSHHPH